MDDFLSTAKFADNSSEIQLALTLYSVGIDILFFKKAKKKKKNTSFQWLEMCRKLHISRSLHIKEILLKPVSLTHCHGTNKFFHNWYCLFQILCMALRSPEILWHTRTASRGGAWTQALIRNNVLRVLRVPGMPQQFCKVENKMLQRHSSVI